MPHGCHTPNEGANSWTVDRHYPGAPGSSGKDHPLSQPHYRTVLGVDIEGSATRSNCDKARIRDAMYDIVGQAFTASGVGIHHRDPFIDRGDGLFTLIYPTDEVPKTLLLSTLVPILSRLLIRHNSGQSEQLRLRVVVHAGEVHYDSRAPFGATLDLAFRLLDAPEVKGALRRTAAPLVLVISGDLYWSVVCHDYEGIDQLAFTPFMDKRIPNVWQHGWLHVPDGEFGRSTGRSTQEWSLERPTA